MLRLHPSRVVRFLGNPWPDPSLAATPWSDSVLQALYDAIHAVALTVAGATSLMHEAKVDVVTVPNLSEHLSSSETTNQLSARFGTAAAMKSINNLLLLGDGETWNRQRVDFAGLPEMVRTFLQVAAGAADIPVTRLMGQSPAGLSATGESDTRNTYDMIAARQELELRPALERLDRIVAASEGIDSGSLTFVFRPLWQLDAATAATIALQKAQATQVYAGLKLWPVATTARLVEAQLAEDGTYPNAKAVFGEDRAEAVGDARIVQDLAGLPTALNYLHEMRDPDGRWTAGAGAGSGPAGIVPVALQGGGSPEVGSSNSSNVGAPNSSDQKLTQAEGADPDEENRRPGESGESEPGDVILIQRFNAALQALREVDPDNQHLRRLEPPDYVPTEEDLKRIEAATREAINARTCNQDNPTGLTEPPAPTQVPVTADPRAAQKLDNALSDYQTRRYTVGNQTFQFDKAGMHDVLERHAPEYWNGRSERTQTFFAEGTTVGQLQDVVRDVLSQNRDEIIADPSAYQFDLEGTSGGFRYDVGIYQGRITHLVPK